MGALNGGAGDAGEEGGDGFGGSVGTGGTPGGAGTGGVNVGSGLALSGGSGGAGGAGINLAGGEGGTGGIGTSGAVGGPGGLGGLGGLGGGGGGVFEVVARGRITVGGNSVLRAAGDSGGGGGTPLAGENGGVAGNEPGEGEVGEAGLKSIFGNGGGTGGTGGEGGLGGDGGPGGAGGLGGAGAGGAGGTVKLSGTVLSASDALVDASGGLGPLPGTADDGQLGRLILASNTGLTFDGDTITGVGGQPTVVLARTETFAGPRASNPYLAQMEGLSDATPTIAGLAGGAEIYGLLDGIDARVLNFGGDDGDAATIDLGLAEQPTNDDVAAIIRLDVGPGSYAGDDYSRFDVLLFANLSDNALAVPKIGALVEGNGLAFAEQRAFSSGLAVDGLNDLQTDISLPAGAIWATLVPETPAGVILQVNASLSFDPFGVAPTTSLVLETLAQNDVAFISAASPDPDIRGLEALVVSPDGQRIYALNGAQDALIVSNADGSQRQLLKQGFDGVDGLDGASDIAIAADGDDIHIYVVSPVQGTVALLLDAGFALEPFVLSEASGRAVFDTVTVSSDGTRVYVGGNDGVAAYRPDLAVGALTQLTGLVSPDEVTGVSELAASQDGALLYAVSRTGDALFVLEADTLALKQSLFGAVNGLDGASDIALDADSLGDNRFVYVTGRDGNTLAVFERLSDDSLVHVQTIQNGVAGVRGLAEPTDVKVTPDQGFVLVTGAVSDAVAVFERRDDTGKVQPVQVVRNNVGGTIGLTAPQVIATSPDGLRTYVGSIGGDGIQGGLVSFDTTTTQPEPIQLLTTFDGIEALGVSTAGGDDTIAILNAPEPEVLSTTISTGGGNDVVTLLDLTLKDTDDLAAGTKVDLGDGADEARIRVTTADGELTLNAGTGADLIVLTDVGERARIDISGGADADVMEVRGKGLPLSVEVVALHGNDPVADTIDPVNGVPADEGDRLLYNPEDPDFTDSIPNFMFTGVPDAGTRQVDERAAPFNGALFGVLNFDTFEEVIDIAPPLIEFASEPFVTTEGSGIKFITNITPNGTGLVGVIGSEITWDLDGDGAFDDAVSAFDAGVSALDPGTSTLSLTWQQLVDFGISDDGAFTIGATASNDEGTSAADTTLTVLNLLPVVKVTPEFEPAVANVGRAFRIDFDAEDPGDDRIARWEILWGDEADETPATPAEVFGAGTLSATHIYQQPVDGMMVTIRAGGVRRGRVWCGYG